MLSRYLSKSKTLGVTRTDLGFVAVVVALELFLYARAVPLPGPDFALHTEPAIYFATEGIVKSPSLAAVDPAFQIAWGEYPPGFPLILGTWIDMFGYSFASITGFHHCVHAISILILYSFLRIRFGTAPLATTLGCSFLIPWYGSFGQPDLTATVIGQLAWLVLGKNERFAEVCLSAFLIACSVLVSPMPGGQFAVIIAADLAVKHSGSWKKMALRLLQIISLSGISFCAIWAAFLRTQPEPKLLLQQFMTPSLLRGDEVAVSMIDWTSPRIIVFFIIPFCIGVCGCLMAPNFQRLLISLRGNGTNESVGEARTLAAFISSSLWCLLISAGQFITGFHYGQLGPALIASKLLSSKLYRGHHHLAFVAILLQLSTLLYFDKTNLLYLIYGTQKEDNSPIEYSRLYSKKVLGLDDLLWLDYYQLGKTQNAKWLAVGSHKKKEGASEEISLAVPKPDFILISEYGFILHRFNERSFPGYTLIPKEPADLIAENLPKYPYKIRIYVSIERINASTSAIRNSASSSSEVREP